MTIFYPIDAKEKTVIKSLTKKIGLLGGTSYPSTVLYYEKLNRLYNEKMGGFHSCPMILYNIDYHEIKSRYYDRWHEIPQLLKQELQTLLSLNPDGLIICNNTLHKAFDEIKDELEIKIPVFHIVELTAEYLKKAQIEKVLLLGTKFTMEDGFFKDYLKNKEIDVVVPDEKERNEIQTIQTALSQGKFSTEYEEYFQVLTDKYQDCGGIILGCTELPLAFTKVKTNAQIVDTIDIQCKEAVEFLLS